MPHRSPHLPPASDLYETMRRDMVDEQLRARGIVDRRVLDAMAGVPRHLFVSEHLRPVSYGDTPLPIGHGQTVSQPLMIALMLQAAELRGHERVLEVGTGSGYQAALLSKLAKQVYTIEILVDLANHARHNLGVAGVANNVEVIVGDGSLGWPAAAPYDVIIVAAGARQIPEPLIDQLALHGRLLIPVGELPFEKLTRVRNTARGMLTEELGFCAFVPLVGALGVRRPD